MAKQKVTTVTKLDGDVVAEMPAARKTLYEKVLGGRNDWQSIILEFVLFAPSGRALIDKDAQKPCGAQYVELAMRTFHADLTDKASDAYKAARKREQTLWSNGCTYALKAKNEDAGFKDEKSSNSRSKTAKDDTETAGTDVPHGAVTPSMVAKLEEAQSRVATLQTAMAAFLTLGKLSKVQSAACTEQSDELGKIGECLTALHTLFDAPAPEPTPEPEKSSPPQS
jgi:hypothetical protein